MWERRKYQRREVRTLGKVIFAQPLSVIDCVVHDISEGGACLELPTAVPTPDTFELIVLPSPRRRACNVMWRLEKRIGIAFR